MKHVAILVVCAMVRSVLSEHWEFGVDPPDSVVLDKKRGEIAMFETITYIELDVPTCFQIEFVSVNVYNLISNPITNFDRHADTVVITYKPWQISASMYDVVAKGRRKPHCKHQQAFEAHFTRHPIHKHTEQNSLEELDVGFADVGLDTNIEANTDSEITTQVEPGEELGSNTETETIAETEVETEPSVEHEKNLETDLKVETDSKEELTSLFLDGVRTKENEINSETQLQTEIEFVTKSNEFRTKDTSGAETESSAEIDIEPGTDLQAAADSRYKLTKLFLDGIKSNGKKINIGTQLNTETELVPKTEAKKAANKNIKTKTGLETDSESVTLPDTESEDISRLTQLLLEKLKEKTRTQATLAESQAETYSEAETQSEEERLAETNLDAESKAKTVKRTDLEDETEEKSLLSRLLGLLMRG